MKTLGKILLCAVILFVGAYWAASNPTTASSVKKAADALGLRSRWGSTIAN